MHFLDRFRQNDGIGRADKMHCSARNELEMQYAWAPEILQSRVAAFPFPPVDRIEIPAGHVTELPAAGEKDFRAPGGRRNLIVPRRTHLRSKPAIPLVSEFVNGSQREERPNLKVDRPLGPEQRIGQHYGIFAMQQSDLFFQRPTAGLECPSRMRLVAECAQKLVAAGKNVPDTRCTPGQHAPSSIRRFPQRGKARRAGHRRGHRRHQQSVIAPGVQARQRGTRVSTEPIGDEPFPRNQRIKIKICW